MTERPISAVIEQCAVIEAENVVYGIAVVPGTDTLAILRRSGDDWYGVSSTHFIEGSAALLGQPLPGVKATLDAAYERLIPELRPHDPD